MCHRRVGLVNSSKTPSAIHEIIITIFYTQQRPINYTRVSANDVHTLNPRGNNIYVIYVGIYFLRDSELEFYKEIAT